MSPSDIRALKRKLLDWYARTRRDLPWRRVRDPYAIWVSETMLQQTQVQTVLPYYERFMRELPNVHALAEAPEGRVLALWSGLGYYRRARMLQAAARRVASEYGGKVPREIGELRQLEGVGAYTAGAIASIAFGRPSAVVDGNVARVLARLFAVVDDVTDAAGRARLWRLAESLVAIAEGDPGEWNQALMELGAMVCVPRAPRCGTCPVRGRCQAFLRGIVAEVPRRAARAPAIAVRRAAVVLASSRAVLLARRRPEALLGGLWEPPGAEGTVAPLAARLGIEGRRLRPAGQVVHVLTHRRMHVEVACGVLGRRTAWPLPNADYDAIEPFAFEDVPALPQSTLARKVLIVANVPVCGLPWKK